MVNRPWNIANIAMFWLFTSRSWRQNAGARELSDNNTLRCILCLAMEVMWRSTTVVLWGFIRKHKNFEKSTRSKTMHWKLYHQLVTSKIMEAQRMRVGEILLGIMYLFLKKISSPYNCTITQFIIVYWCFMYHKWGISCGFTNTYT